MHPKRVTVWCRFWSRGIIGQFFFENEQVEAVTVNNDRYQATLKEFLFTKIKEEDIGNIWFQQDGALHLMFSALFLKIALSAAELKSFGHLRAAFWLRWTIICEGAIEDKCYADKPETTDALKDKIREAIGEIQLLTIDNVLKNWTDRVGHCMASLGSHLNEIIFHY